MEESSLEQLPLTLNSEINVYISIHKEVSTLIKDNISKLQRFFSIFYFQGEFRLCALTLYLFVRIEDVCTILWEIHCAIIFCLIFSLDQIVPFTNKFYTWCLQVFRFSLSLMYVMKGWRFQDSIWNLTFYSEACVLVCVIIIRFNPQPMNMFQLISFTSETKYENWRWLVLRISQSLLPYLMSNFCVRHQVKIKLATQ